MALTSYSFYKTASTAGFSRDFSFRVTSLANVGSLGNLSVYARTASLPGRNIEDKPISWGGVEFHLGGRAIYSNAGAFPIEFYCDEGLALRHSFDSASRATFDMGTAGKGFNIDPGGSIGLQTLTNEGKTGTTVTLHGCCIRDIGDINYQIADGTGEVAVFTVTFAYQWYSGMG
tara:strand:+ start:475 stop:996 length:522 start_codon:yes stop_codon:yes gene_type:complete